MENGSLKSLQIDARASGGGGGGELPMFGSLACAALHGIGSWDLPF